MRRDTAVSRYLEMIARDVNGFSRVLSQGDPEQFFARREDDPLLAPAC